MSRLSERIENFNKAFDLYEEMQKGFLANREQNSYRLGLAQSFEIVSELGWKVIKDYLKIQIIDADTPKEVIKQAFLHNIIPNGQVWIDMINARNTTSHEYNTDKVDKILENISTIYYDELYRLRNWLRSINE